MRIKMAFIGFEKALKREAGATVLYICTLCKDELSNTSSSLLGTSHMFLID